MRRFASVLKCALSSGSNYGTPNCKSLKTMTDGVVKGPSIWAECGVRRWTEATPSWSAQGHTRPAPFAPLIPGVASVHPLTWIEAGTNTRFGTNPDTKIKSASRRDQYHGTYQG
jgi:hypothetical protein